MSIPFFNSKKNYVEISFCEKLLFFVWKMSILYVGFHASPQPQRMMAFATPFAVMTVLNATVVQFHCNHRWQWCQTLDTDSAAMALK